MLRELGQALSEAIAESPDLTRTLRQVRDEGYSLYLLVDSKKGADQTRPLELALVPKHLGEPVFRINGDDLIFLKSIGIDPTRSLRRRRSG